MSAHDFSAYMLAKEHSRFAYADYNAASQTLELARIKERLAELKSQHEPLAKLLTEPLSERDRLYAAAFYAVVGRFPEQRKPQG